MQLFQPETFKHEFEEVPFVIQEWRWDDGYAVLEQS